MVLCCVHSEFCKECKEYVCEGCETLHEQMHAEEKDIIEVLAGEIDRMRDELAAYKATL
jgi:hypothetical protein